ncbi:hypothetical protein Pcinc_034766, partial [Petrolisthes cinctipes]
HVGHFIIVLAIRAPSSHPHPTTPCPARPSPSPALLCWSTCSTPPCPVPSMQPYTPPRYASTRPVLYHIPSHLCSALPCPDPPRSTLLHHIPAHTARPRSFLLTSPRPALPCPSLSRSSPTPARPATSTLLTTSYGHCSN